MEVKQAQIRGVSMAYEDAGKGIPIVLLHGFPFNRSMWSEQAEFLREKFRVITPDLRGHGETTATAEPATMDEMAQDIAALLDELKIDRVVIGGLSMGGYVTLAFYRAFPLRVRALILADTRASADTEEGKKTRETNAALVLAEGMTPIVNAMLPKLLAPATINEQPEIVERVRAMMSGTDPQGAASALRGMAARRDQTDFLAQFQPPTLIIVGREDAITPVSDSELMQREIRGSRLAVIEGAGHVSNLEQPAKFNEALGNFLNAILP